jgi:Ca-activated chloride channel homolog
MRHVHTLALVLVAACSAKSMKLAAPLGPPPGPPQVAVATADVQPSPIATGGQTQVATPEPPGPANDTYKDYGVNPWIDASRDHLSTFAADVDTASYTIARRKLLEGTLPPQASVRVEEFVNYFKYRFPAAPAGSPFSVVLDAAPSPLVPGHYVLRVGVATPRLPDSARKPANLVFLVDTSGSMESADRLPLAQKSLKLLVEQLRPTDSVALVTYAGSTSLVLPATSAENKGKILAAIDRLSSGGSTAMGAGLDMAYEQALKGLRPGAIARVIVCTDGDANVGTTSPKGMLGIIEERAKSGITLSTIGFGMGNYRDDMMEQLADKGNGNNFYIDSPAAARKVFVEDLTSTLQVAAKDTKLQVDFDSKLVARYRLVGYENRNIRDEDFRKDDVDAGEVGVGHQVTALYELELTPKALAGTPKPLATVRIRHKDPDARDTDKATERAYAMDGGWSTTFDSAPADLRFAFAVASFADVLRGAEDAQTWSLDDIGRVAKLTANGDPDRMELVSLIERAKQLRPRKSVAR